jgi:hypothetical protein
MKDPADRPDPPRPREDALAAALRENLRRRKAQQQARAAVQEPAAEDAGDARATPEKARNNL